MAFWREVQLEARMFLKPCSDLRRLVLGAVVEHEMHVARLENGAINAAPKVRELLGSVAQHAFADDHARLYTKCCKQRARTVALVIMGHHAGSVFPKTTWRPRPS